MYHVYLLRSIKKPEMTYVGFTTKNVDARLIEHNARTTQTTAAYIPWKVEVIITFADKQKAEDFERYLKNGSGYVFAKRHFWSIPCSA